MRAIWKAAVVCGALALGSGAAAAQETGVCSLPAAEAAAPAVAPTGAPIGVEQEPLFVDTVAWCCLNGPGACVQSTVATCTAAGLPSFPAAGPCARITGLCMDS